jgi:hypothetical protein
MMLATTCRHAMRFSSSVSGNNTKALKSKISSSSSSRSKNVSLFVVKASSDDDDDKPKVKSYLDAGKKTKTSVGLRNSFYDRFPPVLKSSKTGTQFLRRDNNKKKFQVQKKKTLALTNKSKPISLMNPIKIAASPAKKKNKPISFSATVKPKTQKAFFSTPKVKTVSAKKSKEAYTPFPALKRKRSGPPVKSQYTIKKQPIKPIKQIVNSRGKVAAKAPATKRAQTVVFSNMFASLRGEKKSAPAAAAAPVAKIALPVQMKKNEEQPEKKKATKSYSASSMSKDEIGTYGLIAAFSLASFSSLVVLPAALGDVFELIGFGVSAYFLFSLLVKDDDLGLSKTLDEVESQTGLDVRELTNSTVGLVKDTVSTVSSNTKKTSYPKKSESPKPVVAAVESSEQPKEEQKVNEEGSEAE